MNLKQIKERILTPNISQKALAIFLASLFFVSLIPLLVLSFYNRMAADDYSYSVLTVHAWWDTGSIFQVIGAAFQTVKSFYNVWQGTFSAVFLFALQPALFGDQLYFLTTWVMLGALIFGTGYILFVLIRQYLHGNVWTWMSLSAVVLMISIQLLPDANEAFYWYNGSVYYTFFYSLMLITVGLILQLIKTTSKKGSILRSIGIVLLAFFISGGNYTTALITSILLAAFTVFLFLKKLKASWILLASFIVSVAGLLVSALAPGNAYRAASLTPMEPVEAILHSLYNGVIFFNQWMDLAMFSILLFVFPLVWALVRPTKFTFKYPGLVALGSYFLFSAQLTPPLTAMGDLGSGRQKDIFFFLFVLLVFINFVYFIGWADKKLSAKITMTPISQVSWAFLFVTVAILLVGLMPQGFVSLKSMTSASAFISLIKGDAQTFAMEMDARLALFKNPAISDVVVNPLSVIPPLFHPETLSTNSTIWPNVDLARYYDKDTITLLTL